MPAAPAPAPATAAPLGDDETTVAPDVAAGVPVRWADVASPWLTAVGGDSRSTRYEAGIAARVALRYDDEKADLVHDAEFEAVLFPLAAQVDVTRAAAVDYDDRDLRADAPTPCTYVLTDAPIKDKAFWTRTERDLIDHLVRVQTVELATNRTLKLFSRPGEAADAFFQRCYADADTRGDAETAKLRDKYATKVTRLQTQIQTAEDRAQVLDTERKGRRNEELLSTAGSILGGLLGGRRSRGGLLGKLGGAAGRRSRSSAAGDRLDAAENKLELLHSQLEDLETELTAEVTEIDTRWMAVAKDITTTQVPLERSDVRVTQLALVWIPVP
jgi:hypothetical protein